MKRLLAVVMCVLLGLFMVGCGSNDDSEVIGKKTEMTKEETLEYLEQITYRLVEAEGKEDGSFEQKSSLQAAIGRSESVVEEIEEKYEECPEIIKSTATNTRLGAEKGLDGQYVYIEIYLEMIIDEIEETIGELPQTLAEFAK
jgi:hypothetical protein